MVGRRRFGILFGMMLSLGLIGAPSGWAAPPATIVTYQGVLKDAGSPASGSYDLQFILYNAPSGGSQVGPLIVKDNLPVANGLFHADLDFGKVYAGQDLWVEVAVRAGSSSGAFTVLSPRQHVSAAPYAVGALDSVAALSVPWTGVKNIPAGFADGTDDNNVYTAGAGLSLVGPQLSVVFAGTGAATTAARSDHNHDGLYWKLGGNVGTNPATHFLGTLDAHALNFKVNGVVSYTITPTTVKLGTAGNPVVPAAPNLSAGLPENVIAPNVVGSVIGGGGEVATDGAKAPNTVFENYGVIGGGSGNTIQATNGSPVGGLYGVISGGHFNKIGNFAAFVGGGDQNVVTSTVGVIGGGSANTVTGTAATVGGGASNTASGFGATIAGGYTNGATGQGASVPGGYRCNANADYATAMGYRAKADHEGSFVWSDESTTNEMHSSADNQFNLRAAGGVRIFSNSATTSGVFLSAGGGSWGQISDMNLKTAFSGVDGAALLKRLDGIEIRSWQYKSQDPAVRHIGPTAQDFYGAFGVGEDDRHITTVDEGGVALAAIQALHRQLLDQSRVIESLHRKSSDKEDRIKSLEKKNEALESRLKLLEEKMDRVLSVSAKGRG